MGSVVVLPLDGQDPEHVAPGVAWPQQRGVPRPALPRPHQLNLPQPVWSHAVLIVGGDMVKVFPKSDVKLSIDLQIYHNVSQFYSLSFNV